MNFSTCLSLVVLAAAAALEPAAAQNTAPVPSLDVVPNLSRSRINSVAYSPDGSLILTGDSSSRNGSSLSLWDVATGRRVRAVEGTADAIYAVAFSPDGAHIFSGGNDNMVTMSDRSTGKAFHRPDLLAEKLAGDPTGTVKAAAQEVAAALP